MATPLTIRGVETFGVEVPHDLSPRHQRRHSPERSAALVNLTTEEGITGRTYLFLLPTKRPPGDRLPCCRTLSPSWLASAPVPSEISTRLGRRFALVGVGGVVRMALSALDSAMWDGARGRRGLPLATLLGGSVRPVPAYNSSGLGLMSARSGRR
jgi:mandelate racemase